MKATNKIITRRDLRAYQNEAINQLDDCLNRNVKSVIFDIPTGGGKTTIASDILASCHQDNMRAVFVCDRRELINQTSARLDEDNIDHGIIMADHEKTSWKKQIQVASIQTLARRQKLEVDLIIIDECHVLHKAHLQLIKDNPEAIVIGLSATPYSKGLGKHFQEKIRVASVQELIDLGFLVQPRVFAPSSPDLEKIKVVRGDYDEEELAKATNTPKLVGDIVEHWIQLAKNKPTLVFAVNIAHSKAIREEFIKHEINCEHLDCFTSEEDRKNIIRDFRAGQIEVLTSVDILSKGFDYPGAEVAVLARPTKSLSLYIQQAGRVLRISPTTNKTNCLILDHAGVTEAHGFITDDRDIKLDMGNKVEASAKVEKKENKSICVCPSCAFVKTTFVCENCGYEFKKKSQIISSEGYLIEIKQDDVFKSKVVVKSISSILCADHAKLYGELKTMAINLNWKQGRAYFIFKDIVGDFPSRDVQNTKLLNVSVETQNMVKHLQIKFSKSKYKKYSKI